MEDDKLEDENNVTARVLEYFRLHSQTSDLPKYFSGSLENVQPISNSQNKHLQVTNLPVINIDDSMCEVIRNPSPTSSAASNRKLEWDNGADIGYDNCGKCLQKSVSLPILTTHEFKKNVAKKSNSASQVVFIDNVLESTGSSNKSMDKIEEPLISDNVEILNFLRIKVGVPVAESTPFDRISSNAVISDSTPCSSRSIKSARIFDSTDSNNADLPKSSIKLDNNINNSGGIEVNVTINKQDSTTSDSTTSSVKVESKNQSKLLDLLEKTEKAIIKGNTDAEKLAPNLQYTSFVFDHNKPMVVSNNTTEHGLLPEKVKTVPNFNTKTKSLVISKPIVVDIVNPSILKDQNVQTDADNISVGVQTEAKMKRNQNEVIYMFHPYEDHKKNSNTTTQTDDSDMDFSNCNSFEYLYGSGCDKKTKSSTSTSTKSSKLAVESNLKRTSVKTDLTHVSSNSTDKSISSKENYLSDLLTQQKSSDLVQDIEKSLKLLQKLVKSKRYDDKTKEYYVKKIIKKLGKSHIDDSSVYSENITPNIDKKVVYAGNYNFERNSNLGSYNNTSSGRALSENSRENQLQRNVAWVPPIASEKFTKPNVQKQKVKDPRFTLPNNITSSTELSSSDYYVHDFVLPQKNVPSWKEDKTFSEKLLEKQKPLDLSSGDTLTSPNEDLLHLAKREREYQLRWINNEIEHLGKLKKLLEPKNRFNNKSNNRKSTAVYMITTEHLEKPIENKQQMFHIQSSVGKSNDSAEMDFRLHNDMGSRNYKFREIITKVSPVGQTDSIIDVDSTKSGTYFKVLHKNNPGEQNIPELRSASDKNYSTNSDENGNSCSGLQCTCDNIAHNGIKCEDIENAKIISSTVTDENVRRVILELPIVPNKTDNPKPRRISFSDRQNCKDVLQRSRSSSPHSGSIHGDKKNEKTKHPLSPKTASKLIEGKTDTKCIQTCLNGPASSSDCSASSSRNSIILCSCCRKHLSSDSTLAIDSEIYYDGLPFCPTCINSRKKNSGSNFNQRRCACHIDSSTMEQIKNTLQELHELDLQEEFCKCQNRKEPKKSNDLCSLCKCKIKKSEKKKGTAYLLSFEPSESVPEDDSDKKKVRVLNEIRVKVPGHNGHRKLIKNVDLPNGDNKNNKQTCAATLQGYLEVNKPDFVKSAEERRKCMIELSYLREERCQKYKQLLALTNGIPMQNPGYSNRQSKHVFTTKEMKTITAKNYKKLPEVQQRLLENRDKQIKKANRLLADIFNKKLRENVLKGNPTLSTSISVINLT